METLTKIIMILRDYEADQRLGYIADMYSYVESRCHVLNIPEYQDSLINLIMMTKKEESCKMPE
jgi:hypothetical protein